MKRFISALLALLTFTLVACSGDEDTYDWQFDDNYMVPSPLTLVGKWKLIRVNGQKTDVFQIVSFHENNDLNIYSDDKLSETNNVIYSLTSLGTESNLLVVKNGSTYWGEKSINDISFEIHNTNVANEITLTKYYGDNVLTYWAQCMCTNGLNRTK